MTSGSRARPDQLVGSSIGDERYKVLATLGSGSMGHTYRAFDRRLEIDVAVKVPHASRLANPQFVQRFAQETSLLIRLRHPHIVTVIDVFEHDEMPFMIMDYLAGGSLEDKILGPDGKKMAMPPQFLKRWLPGIALALDFVNKKDIVHRDVKPGNILFDEDGNAFLSDFGLTKVLADDFKEDEGTETMAGGIVGTPNYVAPEIVLDQEFDGRADQYSLGSTVYEVLTGAPPFAGGTSSAVMVRQVQNAPKPLHQVRPDVSETLSQAVLKSLAKKPDQRFENCRHFAGWVIRGVDEQTTPAAQSVTGRNPGSSVRGGASSTRSGASSAGTSKVAAGKTGASKAGQNSPTQSTVRRRKRVEHDYADDLPALPKKRKPNAGAQKPKKARNLSCPACEKLLLIKPEYAGRSGNCAQCGKRIAISRNLSTLTLVTNPQPGDNDDVLVIGQEVFGLKLSTKVAIGVFLTLILTLIGLTVYFTIMATAPEDEQFEEQQIKSFEE